MKYKISIILPVFNVEKYIKEALDSIIRQSIGFENLEVIMVDDCSTDLSSEIIDEYADKYDNFSAIHLPENSGGAGRPRNKGIEISTGEYLMFLDPDDSYAPDACQTLYEKVSTEKVDIVFGTFSIKDQKRKKTTGNQEIKVKTIHEHQSFLRGSPTLWTKIFRREFILNNKIRFPELKAAQDAVFVVNAFLKAEGIIYINQVIIYYTDLRNESVTNKKDKKTLNSRIEAYSQIYNLCKENGEEKYFISSILKDKLTNWLKHFIFSDLSDPDKMEALKLSYPLFRVCAENGITFSPELNHIFQCIVNEKFQDAVQHLTRIKEDQVKQTNTPKDIQFKQTSKPKDIQFIRPDTQINVDERFQKMRMGTSIQEIEYALNLNIEKFKGLNNDINSLTAEFYELEYHNHKGRSLTQRLISKFPSLYILFKINNGFKSTFTTIKGYRAVKKYNLFDVGYYLKTNEDIRASGADPLLHYIYHGYREGRSPHPLFNTHMYLDTYEDVQKSHLNPLLHYALYGKKEGRFSGFELESENGLLMDDVTKPIRENKQFDITIKVPSPNWSVASSWGDYHLALGLKNEFEKHNYQTDIQMFSEWDVEDNADVVLVLRGKFRYYPDPENFNIMWNISHPDTINVEEYNSYDHVFVASDKWARELKDKLNVPVESLLQCTDLEVFYPDYSESFEHELLFVGNSRNMFRKILRDLLPTTHDLAVYGKGWEFLDKRLVKGNYIPNSQLRQAYSSCKILLNDHWDDMRLKGFISNRIFDGFASGAFIISDEISGAQEIFKGALITYTDEKEINELIEYYLKNNEERIKLAQRGREIVLKYHTFEERVNSILKIIEDYKITEK